MESTQGLSLSLCESHVSSSWLPHLGGLKHRTAHLALPAGCFTDLDLDLNLNAPVLERTAIPRRPGAPSQPSPRRHPPHVSQRSGSTAPAGAASSPRTPASSSPLRPSPPHRLRGPGPFAFSPPWMAVGLLSGLPTPHSLFPDEFSK